MFASCQRFFDLPLFFNRESYPRVQKRIVCSVLKPNTLRNVHSLRTARRVKPENRALWTCESHIGLLTCSVLFAIVTCSYIHVVRYGCFSRHSVHTCSSCPGFLIRLMISFSFRRPYDFPLCNMYRNILNQKPRFVATSSQASRNFFDSTQCF